MRQNRFYIAFLILIIFNALIAFYLFYTYKKQKSIDVLANQPLISVIVTSYNYEKYIEKNLKSILNQTYKNYEVIIVEDGSKDNSLNVIKKYTDKYENFHLFTHDNHQNRGLVESVKLGISKSKGKYIAFLESDDYWHKDNLLEKVRLINKYSDLVLAANNVEPFGKKNSLKIRRDYIKRINEVLFKEKNQFHPLQLATFNIIPTLSCVIIRKDVLETLNFDTIIPQFLDFWLYRQILLNHHLYYSKKVLTYWRQHDSYNSVENYEKIQTSMEDFIKANNEVIFNTTIK